MTPGTLTLADSHLDLLYERDESGLLLRARAPSVAAPLFHLVRTAEGNRWFVSAALPAGRREEIQTTLSREPLQALSEMEASPPLVSAIAPTLQPGTNPTEYRGPEFIFPNPLITSAGSAELLAEPGGTRTVPELAWVRTVSPAEHPIAVARNSVGEIVSVCHSSRSTAGAAAAGVETAPAYRGCGLAASVVHVWATAVLAQGRVPFYGTQWTNHASRAVARKLGLIHFGEDYHVR